IQDGPQVIHPRLERRRLAHPVGEAGASPVEQDQAAEFAEALVKLHRVWILELAVEVPGEAVDVDEIDRPDAEHRVRDRDVAARGVTDLRLRLRYAHGLSFDDGRGSVQA